MRRRKIFFCQFFKKELSFRQQIFHNGRCEPPAKICVFYFNSHIRPPVQRSHRSSSMAIAVPWGPSMAINGPSMGIDEVFLTLIPSMGHRWTIDDPSMGIVIFHHKNSFDLAMFKISTKLWHFKFFIQSI